MSHFFFHVGWFYHTKANALNGTFNLIISFKKSTYQYINVLYTEIFG